jgi:arabinofuranan 3-O-arabinosyltransferase
VTVSLLQSVGRTTFDTKFDLTSDPARALGRSLTLWGSEVDFGGLQNQGYGYLFPQGTWFVLADLLHVSDWIAQRAWSALVLLAAYEGARRLARALGIGQVATPVVVGLAYALAPRLFGLSGSLTGEILPAAFLPWVCLPLVLALAGRMSARRAGVLSALAVVCMGGVNAAENLATMPLPLLLVASGLASAEGRRLARWWAGCTALACLWWMLPLLLLGRYSVPFLDYIETARATTAPTGWSNSVRGADHWLNYIFVGGRPWWDAANAMSTSPVLVVLGGVIAALGLVGLVLRRMPHRWAFGLSAVLGLVLLTAGHGGIAGTPLDGVVRDLLDGPLVAFRNVHKFDPLVRLPLALGFGVACVTVTTSLVEEESRAHRAAVGSKLGVERLRAFAVGAAVVVLVASAAPMFRSSLRHPGWDHVPRSWEQAAAWLDDDGPGATLVLPSTGFGQQQWGWTVDEPIQGLAASAWVARTQIPLVPPTTIRWMDGIEDRLEDGTGSPVLARTLASAGVTRILVRHDVDTLAADVADPLRVEEALDNSPGLSLVKTFGRAGSATDPVIEVYRVVGSSAEPVVTPDSELPVLTGAPEDVIAAREAGLLAPGQHATVGLAPRGSAPDIVADGYRRVIRQFGRFHDATGQVMTRDEPARGGRKVTDYAGVDGVPRVYARYDTLTDVTASSSSGYADAVGQIRPELGPASAVDGDPGTYWRSAPFEDARGQWVQLDLREPTAVRSVRVVLGVDGFSGTPVTRVAVEAGGERRELPVDRTTGEVVANFSDAPRVSRVRVTIEAVRGNEPIATAAIREISIPGLGISRSLVVPDVDADAHTSFLFSSDPPRRACVETAVGPRCDPFSARPGAEQGRVRRTFTVHEPGAWQIDGSVVALPTPATAELLQPVGRGVSATASDVLGNDPSVSGRFAVDGRSDTPWLVNPGDPAPSLDLRWGRPRRLDRLRVDAAMTGALTPYEAVVEAAGQTRVVPLGADQLGYFAPIVARSARITFHTMADLQGLTRPMGIGEVHLSGLGGLVRGVPLSWPLRTECGLGPDVHVGAVVRRTQVSGTLGDVVAGRPLKFRSCGGPVAHGSGEQDLSGDATAQFTPVQVVVRSESAVAPAAASRAVAAESPVTDTLTARVGEGPASVLSFHQNVNAGWHATLGGKSLRPTVVDGWQQGFEVPAGAGGTVVVDYPPGTAYRVALALGGLAVLVLLALLVLDVRRPRPPVLVEPRRWGRRTTLALAGTGTVLLAVLGGPAVALGLAGGVVACVRLRASTPVTTVAGLLVLVSAIAAVYSPGNGSDMPPLANLAAAVAVGLLVAVAASPQSKSREPTDGPA